MLRPFTMPRLSITALTLLLAACAGEGTPPTAAVQCENRADTAAAEQFRRQLDHDLAMGYSPAFSLMDYQDIQERACD